MKNVKISVIIACKNSSKTIFKTISSAVDQTFNSYEIYCISGQLFDDIERYHTLEQAENRINELLK